MALHKICLFILSIALFSCSGGGNIYDEINPGRTLSKKAVADYFPDYVKWANKDTESGCVLDENAILENRNLEDMIKLLENSRLSESNQVKEIPGFIMDFLKCTRGGDFRLANPGEDWCSTDVIINDMPRRQLIYYGKNDNIALLAYYSGGWGIAEHILLFRLNANTITDFWCGIANSDMSDKAAILSYLESNKDKEDGLNTNLVWF